MPCKLWSFSALQRAENSSIADYFVITFEKNNTVSVLFSEPKIPQLRCGKIATAVPVTVSVLFSEPKIPQFSLITSRISIRSAFQCSSASRKFLNQISVLVAYNVNGFQCSSASRKFLNASSCNCVTTMRKVSVLFSEPKIPQFDYRARNYG